MPDITTKTQIANEMDAFYDRNLLFRATPQLVHTLWAQIRDIPRKAGTDTIRFRRYGNLAAATTPLTEGITPDGKQLSVTNITATVAQYGDYVTLSDLVDMTSADQNLIEAGEILGDQAADTLDQLTRDILNAGTVVARAGARATRVEVVAGDVLTSTLVDTGVLALKTAKARKITSMVEASTGFNTTPVPACFIGIIHTNLSATVKAFTGFVPVEKYPSQKGVLEGEIGTYNQVRFIETTNSKVFTGLGGGGIDVYSCLLIANYSYGTTRISSEALKNIIKPLGSGGTSDPLNQRVTSGWKGTFVAKILNDTFLYRIECAQV
ncbi:MAG: N4-gp56 family major capsid protein [Patescibacteria group bacterium]